MTVDKWDQRQLCSDGGCVGVIGPDGTCKVCGRAAPNWGDERTRGLNPDANADAPADADASGDEDDDEYEDDDGEDGEYEDDEDEDEEDDADEPAAQDVRPSAIAPVASGDWDDRELCSNGACIGVIGDDNKCRVCGTPGTAVARVIAPAAVITTDDAVADASAIATTDAVKTDPQPPDTEPPGETPAAAPGEDRT